MISRNTPPGTKIIYTPPDRRLKLYGPDMEEISGSIPYSLIPNYEYTLAAIEYYPEFKVEHFQYLARVFEAPQDKYFSLELFNYKPLPESITSLLVYKENIHD